MVNKRRHAHIPYAKKVLFSNEYRCASLLHHLEREHCNDEKKLFHRLQEERDHLVHQQVDRTSSRVLCLYVIVIL